MKTATWILMSAALATALAACKASAGPAPAGRPSEVIIKHCTG
jgi:hypothetical protein